MPSRKLRRGYSPRQTAQTPGGIITDGHRRSRPTTGRRRGASTLGRCRSVHVTMNSPRLASNDPRRLSPGRVGLRRYRHRAGTSPADLRLTLMLSPLFDNTLTAGRSAGLNEIRDAPAFRRSVGRVSLAAGRENSVPMATLQARARTSFPHRRPPGAVVPATTV